ncbi:MAG: hypothetical protein M3Z75_16870 [Actinomycetota bacterium]|nr:hypothetical protein [Actinomycetota bacterium]
MVVIELSNHPADMLDDAQRQRGETSKRELARYEDELSRYRAGVQAVQVKRDQARAQHRWWLWLRLVVAAWTHKRQAPRRPVLAGQPTDQEEILKAGIAGKYDNYGNLVEQRAIADRKGRSPSMQLNEPAADLEWFLRERGQPVTVRRVVVLAHRRSRLGDVRHPTVLAGTSAGYLLSLLGEHPDQLDGPQRASLRQLIQHDHDVHDKTRRPSRRLSWARWHQCRPGGWPQGRHRRRGECGGRPSAAAV